MKKSEKLLYRIDESTRKVVFVYSNNPLETCKSLSDDDLIIMTFDDVLRDIIVLTKTFPEIENNTEIIKNRIDLNANEEMAIFEERFVKSDNFFIRYFSNDLYTTFVKEEKKQKYIIDITLITIRTISRFIIDWKIIPIKHAISSDCSFVTSPQKHTEVGIERIERVVIKSGTKHNVLNIANRNLSNFFKDFFSSVNKMNLCICTCNYCQNHFFGDEKDVCCSSEICQSNYQKDLALQARRDKDNEVYKKPETKLSNYIGYLKTTLSFDIKEYPSLEMKWDNQRKVSMKEMKDTLKEYKEKGILPDKKIDELYGNTMQLFKDLREELENEANEMEE